jgi:hypothetical protein
MTRARGWCGSCAGALGRWWHGGARRWCCCRPRAWDVPAIARVAFTSEDRVRDVIRNFSADGFSSLYPKVRSRAGLRGSGIPGFHVLRRQEARDGDVCSRDPG